MIVLLIASLFGVRAEERPAGATVAQHMFTQGGLGCFDGNRADGANHSYYKSNLWNKTDQWVDWVVAEAWPGAGINGVEHSSLSSHTDVYIVDWDVGVACGRAWDTPGDEVHGWSTCLSEWTSGACDQNRVLFDTSTIGHPWTTTKKGRSLVCHETGHSLGAKHYFSTNSCMNTGLWSNNNNNRYGGHMKDDIDAAY